MGLMMIWRNLGNSFSVFMFGESLTCSHEVCPSSTLLLIQPFYSCLPSISHSLSLSPSWLLPLSLLVSLSVSTSVLHWLHFHTSLRRFSSFSDCFYWSASTSCSLPLSSLTLQQILQILFALCWVVIAILLCLISSLFSERVRGFLRIKKCKIKPSLSFSLIRPKLILNNRCKATVACTHTHTHTYFTLNFHSVVSNIHNAPLLLIYCTLHNKLHIFTYSIVQKS